MENLNPQENPAQKEKTVTKELVEKSRELREKSNLIKQKLEELKAQADAFLHHNDDEQEVQ